MVVRFWGVRGSVPTPLTPAQVRGKISTAIARVSAEDLVSSTSRERFLASLPPWLFGCAGSNTSCVEIDVGSRDTLLLDAGSGIQEFSRTAPTVNRYHVFFSHFHYDHLQGLPFFGPAYVPGTKVTFYSPVLELEAILKQHMQAPFFPVTMDGTMQADLRFRVLGSEPIRLENCVVTYKKMNHPGDAFAYKVVAGKTSVIYATDTELTPADFEDTEENREFFRDADMVILDAQYTLGEAIEKHSWGHSSYSLGVDFAKAWGIRSLYLFHHEPRYDDHRLHRNLLAARWYAQRIGYTELEIELAKESQSVQL